MLGFMLKNSLHSQVGAEALNQPCVNGTFNVVVRTASVVLISILISNDYAEPA